MPRSRHGSSSAHTPAAGGPAGGDAQVRIRDGESVLASESVRLEASTPVIVKDIAFNSGAAGVKDLAIELIAPAADPLPGNNARSRLLDVTASRYRVLYLEGEPRWEFKFIRRAVAKDDAIDLATWLRTTPRQDLSSRRRRPRRTGRRLPGLPGSPVRLPSRHPRQPPGDGSRRPTAPVARRLRRRARRQPAGVGRPQRPGRRRLGRQAAGSRPAGASRTVDGCGAVVSIRRIQCRAHRRGARLGTDGHRRAGPPGELGLLADAGRLPAPRRPEARRDDVPRSPARCRRRAGRRETAAPGRAALRLRAECGTGHGDHLALAHAHASRRCPPLPLLAAAHPPLRGRRPRPPEPLHADGGRRPGGAPGVEGCSIRARRRCRRDGRDPRPRWRSARNRLAAHPGRGRVRQDHLVAARRRRRQGGGRDLSRGRRRRSARWARPGRDRNPAWRGWALPTWSNSARLETRRCSAASPLRPAAVSGRRTT